MDMTVFRTEEAQHKYSASVSQTQDFQNVGNIIKIRMKLHMK